MSKPANGTALSATSTLYSATIQAAYLMAENAGTTVGDSKSGTYNLTINSSVTWVTDDNGDVALHWDGTSTTSAHIANNLLIDATTDSWSVAFRVKITDLSGIQGIIWLGGNCFLFFNPTGNTVTFSDFISATGYSWTVSSANQGVLSDYVVLYNRGDQKLHLWRNGAEVTPAVSVSSDLATTAFFYFGSNSAPSNLIGTMSYLVIYDNLVLSSSQISQFYTNPWNLWGVANAGAVKDNGGANGYGILDGYY